MKTQAKTRTIRFLGYVATNPAMLIFLAASVLRVSLVFLFPDIIPEAPDKITRYDPIALSLMRGEGFSIKGNPTAIAGPVYPFLLSVIYSLFSYSKTISRLFLCLVDAGQCALFYFIARRYSGKRTAALVALALIFSPYFIYAIFAGSADTMLVFFHGLFLLSLSLALQKQVTRNFVVSGALLGLTALTKPVPLLLPVFIAPVFVSLYQNELRRGLLHLAVFLLSFTLIISPWIARGYLVFHRLVPVQVMGGLMLYYASPGKGPDEEAKAAGRRPQELDSVERDRFYLRRGLENIRRDPLGYLKLMKGRLIKMWYQTHSRKYQDTLFRVNGSLLILAVIGMIMSWRRWRDLQPLYAVTLYYIILHTVLVAQLRYLLPIIPILTIFAMVPVITLFNGIANTLKPAGMLRRFSVQEARPDVVITQEGSLESKM